MSAITRTVSNFWARLTRAININDDFNSTGWSIVRGTTPSVFQGSGAEVRRRGWESHPIVNACGRVIVDLIKSVPLEVYATAPDGDETVIEQHPALDLLNAPRPGLSGGRLIGRTAMQFFLYGNAFWVLERRGNSVRGIPRSIRIVNPENIQHIWLAQDDSINAYDWVDLQGRTHNREPVENVVHFRDLDATDGLFGYPRLASALLDIMADSEASQYVRQVVGNHGTPGLAVMVDGAPTQEELDRGEAKWREKYTRLGNRGMTAFMAGVTDLKEIGFNLQQLEFPDLRNVTREDICAAANIDPRMVGLASATKGGGLNGEQYREARFRLIQQTVYPIMRNIEDELNYWFMPEYGEAKVRFCEEYIAAITEDVALTSARVVAEVTAKIRTVEEGREAVGLPTEMDPSHHTADGLTVQESNDNASAMGVAEVKMAQNPPPVALPSQSKPATAASNARALVRADVSSDTAGLEDDYAATAERQFAREREDVLRMLASLAAISAFLSDSAVATMLRQIATMYAVDGPVMRAWMARYDELVGRAVMAGGEALAKADGLDFSIGNPKVQGLVRRRTFDLAQSVTQTTQDAIRAAVLTARQQNMTIPQLAQLIRDTTFGAITKSRAQTIARTEVVGAKVSGQYAAAVQSGIMRSKTWITNMDGRERESHHDLHGTTIDIGQAFANGLRFPHDPLGSASEVINCRCTLKYHDQTADEVKGSAA